MPEDGSVLAAGPEDAGALEDGAVVAAAGALEDAEAFEGAEPASGEVAVCTAETACPTAADPPAETV